MICANIFTLKMPRMLQVFLMNNELILIVIWGKWIVFRTQFGFFLLVCLFWLN